MKIWIYLNAKNAIIRGMVNVGDNWKILLHITKIQLGVIGKLETYALWNEFWYIFLFYMTTLNKIQYHRGPTRFHHRSSCLLWWQQPTTHSNRWQALFVAPVATGSGASNQFLLLLRFFSFFPSSIMFETRCDEKDKIH